jgi:two-component system NtrC family sensor kinase
MAIFTIYIIIFVIIIIFIVLFFILYIEKKYKRPINYILFAISEFIKDKNVQYIPVDKIKHLEVLINSINLLLMTIKKLEFDRERCLKEIKGDLEKKTIELENIKMCLMKSDKLVSVGKLSAGVVHEINNHLTGILTSCQFISDNPQKSKIIEDDVRIIIEETNKCKKIACELLNFAKNSDIKKELYNINSLLEDIFILIHKQTIQNNIDIIKKLAANVPLARFDPYQIEQVFLNIIINAIEAMPEGGALTVQTQVKSNKKQIEISFTDTGSGIPSESLDKIFEPFYTTKSEKGGTGLGLTICKKIIEEHNGTIEVKSFIDVGAMFTITLPVTL